MKSRQTHSIDIALSNRNNNLSGFLVSSPFLKRITRETQTKSKIA